MTPLLFVQRHRSGVRTPRLSLLAGVVLLTFPQICPAQNFVLRSQAAGLLSVIGTNGVAVADYDRDGYPDIYFVAQDTFMQNDKRTWNRLFRNKGNGTFEDVTTTAGINARSATSPFSYMGYKLGASWGDYDNDGYPDLFITNLGPDQLFHNNGNGTFTDVTTQAGVAGGSTQISSSAVWFDYDRDGDLDLYVCNWADLSTGTPDTKNWMYENLGNGTFKDVSEASGLADPHKTWMAVALDANNDGFQDLVLANDFGPVKLYINDHDKTFLDRTTEFGVEGNYEGMGLAVADCDGNGYPDVYLTNVTENGSPTQINPLFLNSGNSSFTKVVDAGVALAGWGWGTEFFDLENDGDEDLFVVNGYFSLLYTKRLFRNESDSGVIRFREMSHEVGLIDSAEARGVVIFDYDNDGREDVLISHFTTGAGLYHNLVGQGNWLNITLEGTVSNRDAFGAIVEVQAGTRTFRKYHHGAQFLGQNILPVHVGLGAAQTADRIRVFWPSGNMDDLGPLGVNQSIRIKENSGVVSSVGVVPPQPQVPHTDLTLVGNYPNPFNGSTQIRFELLVPGEVEAEIFDIVGQSVAVVRQSYSSAGEKTIGWPASSNRSGAVSSGVYFYRIRVNNGPAQVRTMIVLK